MTRACGAADAVAQLIVDSFDALPRSGKPIVRSNGFAEWTVLAGIAVHKEKGTSIITIRPTPAHSPFFESVESLTGSRCKPALHLLGNGREMLTEQQGSRCRWAGPPRLTRGNSRNSGVQQVPPWVP